MVPLLSQTFDELTLGACQTTRGRTIGESDLIGWCASTGDWFPLHSDAVYAASTMFGERIAPGIMILAYITGLGVPAESRTILANYGFERVRFPRATLIGDTVTLHARVAALTERDDRSGIVTLDWDGLNQNGDTVCASQLKVLVARAVNGVRASVSGQEV